MTSPPTMGAAMRFITSAPVPALQRTGTRLRVMVMTVITCRAFAPARPHCLGFERNSDEGPDLADEIAGRSVAPVGHQSRGGGQNRAREPKGPPDVPCAQGHEQQVEKGEYSLVACQVVGASA